MAPRRSSGGSSSSSSYYSDDNPWSQEIQFSLDAVRSKSLFIAGFAFDVLTILALIIFLVWACIIPNGRGQLKGVLSALFAYLTAMICILIYEIFFLADATVTMYYVIDLMLNELFFLLAGCLLFFVFYNLIHSLLDRLTDSGKPYAVVAVVHWVLLGLVSLLSLATFALFVAVEVQFVQENYNSSLGNHYFKMESARGIIWWILSLEIVAWFIFIAVKAGSHRFTSKLPVFSLIVGSVSWMALNMMYAVIYIRYTLETNTSIAPKYLNTVESVCQFFFVVGIFGGILLACMKWRNVDDRPDKHGPEQYPAGTGPYQSYQHYQQQYPPQAQQYYQQQPYQQPYSQPPPQQPLPQAQPHQDK
ncbi:uncharacterized protein N7482_006598 [Penicillium canariense]|uniref:Uncharacterized protein n=1 Tax=Penicillium canariense TaxID=189055 RepID=A0A9W9HWN3_9EURO|nr:uncharacterized protein N7482_006598 [Penicillium canariense]KAJ5159594.1 hypothetical protein N7482_006598 [Penicillium canariense]